MLHYPNVLGTGFGVKRCDGEIIDPHAFVVFVSRKVGAKRLLRSTRLPKSVVCGGRRVVTDVVQIENIRREFGDAPYGIADDATRGTLSAFARNEDGSLYGVSCAHCLAGADGNPHTTTAIDVWDSVKEEYVLAGQSVFAVAAPGYGLPGNFGFSDAGLFTLEHPQLTERARTAVPLSILDRPSRATTVVAHAYGADFTGELDALDVIIGDFRADALIYTVGAGTFPGNSGMMWRSKSGQAVAIHAYGANFGKTRGSRYSLAMSARRAAYQLQTQLLDAG
jgi:hypothetical protein